MNNLLAAVLILTVVPPNVGFSEAALEHCCFLISQKLIDKDVCPKILCLTFEKAH